MLAGSFGIPVSRAACLDYFQKLRATFWALLKSEIARFDCHNLCSCEHGVVKGAFNGADVHYVCRRIRERVLSQGSKRLLNTS